MNTPEHPTPLDPGRSIVTVINEENRQIVCDHIIATGEMVLSIAPIMQDIENKIIEDGFETGKLSKRGQWYQVVYKRKA